MRTLLLGSGALLAFAASAAAADRPITDDERVRLVAALQAQGCSGGEFEFDDATSEVGDARWADGQTYDLRFDASMRLVEKERDD
jgi:hypothetical protein